MTMMRRGLLAPAVFHRIGPRVLILKSCIFPAAKTGTVCQGGFGSVRSCSGVCRILAVEHVAESLEAQSSLAGDIGLGLGLAVEFPLKGHGVGFGFLRGGGVEEVEGDHAGGSGSVVLGQGERGLEEALGADEVDLEGGGDRIAPPAPP